jgi:formylglycine-generating enzyme required for sulfatase activity
VLTELGLNRVREGNLGRDLLERVRYRLVDLLAGGHLGPVERAAAGDTLAELGDPRFREDAWYLPHDPLLGFVEIPEGPFVMGSDEAQDEMARDNEQPQHRVTLPTYYIARYPVTVAQFRAFVEDSGYEPDIQRILYRLDNRPVVGVTWYDALEYCGWLTHKLHEWESTPEPLATLLREEGWVVTLPSEAEWEKAARGINGRRYPWGNDLNPNKANYTDTGIGAISTVGCFPGGASPYGVEDLSGNVWEWTRSLWKFGYPYDHKDSRENLEVGGDTLRVVRGGSFSAPIHRVRCAYRNYRSLPIVRYSTYGFRVCVVSQQN